MAEKQQKVDRTVVRNQPYKRGGIGIRERHNERKNESYTNPDIEPERSNLNINFRRCDTTYEKALEGMLERGEVSTRGLKEDAKVFAEMVFDVNTAYFERHGGYNYARQFFEEVYHFAEKEVGSPYILSATMHADERNQGLSDKLGKPVYHYHMHVIYLPVVEKEVKWSKRCRDPSLVGTVKAVIHQISHSKKWAFQTIVDEKGEPKRIASYSLLQTRFFNHMKEAGFSDLERGVEGSTAEHLDVVEFKVTQERERLKEIRADTMESEMWLDDLKDRIRAVEPIYHQLNDVSNIGKKKRFSDKIELTAEEFEKLSDLAKFGIKAKQTIDSLTQRLRDMTNLYETTKAALDKLKEFAKPFAEAMKVAEERVIGFLFDTIDGAKQAAQEKKLAAQKARAAPEKKPEIKVPQQRWQIQPKAQSPPNPKPRNRSSDRER
ncbi:MAG: plasmid recombination protein [Oscillospiraceae bacterium]|jgi:hypothetical protein|nr:plasmid recombination protein [Oscillospiraceae bacterium]